MRKLRCLLALFSYSVSASKLNEKANGGLQPSETNAVLALSEEFAHLTLFQPDGASDGFDLAEELALAEAYNLKQLDEALKRLIRVQKVPVTNASTILLGCPLFRELTKATIDEAVWNGRHHFLYCLQNEKIINWPSSSHTSVSVISVDDWGRSFTLLDHRRALHEFLAHSYKRSWAMPLFFEKHRNEMDWDKFWKVIFKVDNVELFKDLVTQKLSLPFNRLVNLEKSKLSDLVKQYNANKIGTYLEIPGCKEAIVFDEDGHLNINRFKWRNSGSPLFNINTVISTIIKSNNLDFLESFMSTYPQRFPFINVAKEALKQAQFDIFYWVHSKNPKKVLKKLDLNLGILGSDHLEERCGFLRWIFEQFPGWTLDNYDFHRLHPKLLNDLFKLKPDLFPKEKVDFPSHPSYGLLKWALENGSELIPINKETLSRARMENDLELFNFIYAKYRQEGAKRTYDVDNLAFEMGSIDAIGICMERCGAPEQSDLIKAAENGHVETLKWLAEKGYKIDFAKMTNALSEISDFDHNVAEYIREKYPEIFQNPVDIGKVLHGNTYRRKDHELELIKRLYEWFAPDNARLSLSGLVDLTCRHNTRVFDFIFEKYPNILKDEIEKSSEKAHQAIKKMVLYAATDKHRKGVEFLMGHIKRKLDWTREDLRFLAEGGAFYLLDMIYRDHSENLSLWDPLQDVENQFAYLQWYHHRVDANLPWKDLAYCAVLENDIDLLHWILTKSPNVLDPLKPRLKAYNNEYSRRLRPEILTLITKGSSTLYYIPEDESVSIEDDISLYYKECGLQSVVSMTLEQP